MVRNNNFRLTRILANYKECLQSIDQSFAGISSVDLNVSDISKRAFKADIVDLFKILEDYISLVLKDKGISISQMTVMEALNTCDKFGYLSQGFYEASLKHKLIRDKYSHDYGKPSIRNFIDFYRTSKTIIENQVEIIERIIQTNNTGLSFFGGLTD